MVDRRLYLMMVVVVKKPDWMVDLLQHLLRDTDRFVVDVTAPRHQVTEQIEVCLLNT